MCVCLHVCAVVRLCVTTGRSFVCASARVFLLGVWLCVVRLCLCVLYVCVVVFVCLFVCLIVCSVVRSFDSLFVVVRLFCRSFVVFVCLFAHLFVCMFVWLWLRLFVCLVVGLLICVGRLNLFARSIVVCCAFTLRACLSVL